MRLNLRDILHQPGASRSFDFALDLSQLDFNGSQPISRPVQVAGAVRNMADALVLEGEAVTTLSLVCDRCLEPFTREMRVPVEALLAESLANGDGADSDDILLLEDGEVDLDEVFTTAVVLAMDSKHLCSEDCKGLCPGCGANLNREPCRCRKEVDPRLAALAQLLDKPSETES